MQWCIKTLWLDVASHVTSFDQSECIISVITLKKFYGIGYWFKQLIIYLKKKYMEEETINSTNSKITKS